MRNQTGKSKAEQSGELGEWQKVRKVEILGKVINEKSKKAMKVRKIIKVSKSDK